MQKHITGRFLFVAWAIAALGSGPASPVAAEPVVSIRLDSAARQWLLEEKQCRIFAAPRDGTAVLEFDPAAGKQIRRIDVGSAPQMMAAKRRRLLVVAEKGPTLFVIDLDNNKVERHMELPCKGVVNLSCSQADNGFAYVLCEESKILQIDVDRGTIVNSDPTHNWMETPGRLVFSPDGRQAGFDNQHVVWPTSVGLIDVDEKRFSFAYQWYGRDFTLPVVAGPWNRYWLFGNRLYRAIKPPDFEDPVLRGAPAAIHPHRAVAVSFLFGGKDSSLVFQHLTQGQVLGTVTLPGAERPTPEGHTRRQSEINGTLQIDAEGRHVFFAAGATAFVVDFSSLKIDTDPLLLLLPVEDAAISLGQTWRHELALANPTVRAAAEFKLVDAPPGLQVDTAGRLSWTPTSAEVGLHKIRVLAKLGRQTDAIEFSIRVIRPALELGLLATKLAADPVNGRAAVTGPTAATVFSKKIARQDWTDVVALVDVSSRKITSRRQLNAKVEVLAVGPEGVYYVPENSATLYRLRLPDLADAGHVSVPHKVLAIDSLPGGRIVAGGEGRSSCFTAQTLESLPFPGADWGSGPNERDSNSFPRPEPTYDLVVPVNGGYLINGLIVDPKSGKPRVLVDCPAIPVIGGPLGQDQNGEMYWERIVGDAGPRRWNRTASEWELDYHAEKQKITDWQGGYPNPLVMQKFPLAAVATLSTPPEYNPLAVLSKGIGTGKGYELRAWFYDLLEGKVLEQILLTEAAAPGKEFKRFEAGFMLPLVRDAGDSFVVALWDRMYVVTPSAQTRNKAPSPVGLAMRQGPLSAKVGTTAQLDFHAQGGRGRIIYALKTNSPAIHIDSATGQVTVNTEAAWKAFVDQMGSAAEFGESYVQQAWEHLEAGAKVYQRILGEKPGDVPVSVQFVVSARDEDNQTDELPVQFVLLGPRGQIDARVAEVFEAARREAENRAAAQRRQQLFEQVRSGKNLTEALSSALAARSKAQADLGDADRRLSVLEKELTAATRATQALKSPQPSSSKTGATPHGAADQSLTASERLMGGLENGVAGLEATLLADKRRLQWNWLLLMSTGAAEAVALALVGLLIRRGRLRGAGPPHNETNAS